MDGSRPPLRVLFVSHSFPPRDTPLDNVGGMQRVATELCAALAGRPDVVLTARVLRSSWRWIGVKVVPFLVGLVVEIPRVVREQRIEVVLFSSVTTALPGWPLSGRLRRGGCRVAAIAHGLDVTKDRPGYRLAVRRTLAAMDLVLPVSRATAAACVQRGARPPCVRVVPNAIDLERFAGAARLRACRGGPVFPDAPLLSEDTFLVASVGRQVRRKGFAWFVSDVMPRLDPRVSFWLAGDGPERARIKAAAARAGLHERVRLLGTIPEQALVALYARADLFVMPNVVVPGDMEGFGLVALEAGACGVPTLAAELEGIRDVVTEGVNGLFAPSGDAAAFAERIARQGLYLPSGLTLTEGQIEEVSEAVVEAMG